MDSEVNNAMHAFQPDRAGSPAPRMMVGIGAAANGIETLRALFRTMPTETGMAFVVVQPLGANQRSEMADLLRRETSMPVVPVLGKVIAKPDHVYLAPGDRYLAVAHGTLRPCDRKTGGRISHPIDSFFRALARDQRDRCAAVILSGHGEDGTVGARCVRAAHGLVLVEASGPGLRSVAPDIDGIGSLLLSTESMAAALSCHAARNLRPRDGDGGSSPSPETLAEILGVVKARSGRDFCRFRRPMLHQRLQRRMASVGLNDVKQYLGQLRQTRDEASLQPVTPVIDDTRFFRDAESFAALAATVDALLLNGSVRPEFPLRVWVPGCGTGEEAYSIAMILLEQRARHNNPPPLLVFASDIDPTALATGRAGYYPNSIADDMPPDRLKKFFVHDDTGFRVSRALRRVVTFSQQDLMVDPPFAEIDLISCRNLLTALEPTSQRHVLSLFQFALNNDGILFLGNGETPGPSPDLFLALDQVHRIYARAATLRRFPVAVPMSPPKKLPLAPASLLAPREAIGEDADYAALTHRLLSDIFAPAAVLIDDTGRPLYFSGPVDLYLDLSAGPATAALITLAHCGLKGMLRRLIHQATRLMDAEQVSATVRTKRNGSFVSVRLSVFPTIEPKHGAFLLLVCFADEAAPAPTGFETPWRFHTGQRLPVAMTPTPLHDGSSGQSELTPFDSMQGTLETMVRTRTERLETSNHDLEEFAYVISHDLQEPLRMVTGYLDLIERRYQTMFDAEAHEFIAFAVDGARRMQAMIHDLLDLSRISRDNHDLVVVPLGLALETALKALAPAIKDCCAQITVQPTLPSVLGNEISLGRLFQNLICNALKYRHPDRAPQVRIEAKPEAGLWRIDVIDNGIGIAPQFQERVFGIFQRLHPSDKIPGTGIGLAAARKIVTSHGGRIWVDSSPGNGSAFCFTLHGADAAGPSPPPDQDAGPPCLHQPDTIDVIKLPTSA